MLAPSLAVSSPQLLFLPFAMQFRVLLRTWQRAPNGVLLAFPRFPLRPTVLPMKPSHVSVLMLVASILTSGCVKVAPYQRGTLAHPSMTTDDIAIGVDGHVRGVSEGAAGGLGGGGGGCGCN